MIHHFSVKYNLYFHTLALFEWNFFGFDIYFVLLSEKLCFEPLTCILYKGYIPVLFGSPSA